MDWNDVTLEMHEDLPAWPGDQAFRQYFDCHQADGDSCELSHFICSSHFGTHVDAPGHYLVGGKRVPDLEPGLLIGPCQLIEIDRQFGEIETVDLDGTLLPGTLRLLVKTINSKTLRDNRFHLDYLSFAPATVTWLLGQGVRLLGIDYFSIGPYGEIGDEVHRIFFRGNDTVALEGLDLSAVGPGTYQLLCLQLKIAGAEGAPARVLLGNKLPT